MNRILRAMQTLGLAFVLAPHIMLPLSAIVLLALAGWAWALAVVLT